MGTFEEFSKIAEIIEKNQKVPVEKVIYEYGDLLKKSLCPR